MPAAAALQKACNGISTDFTYAGQGDLTEAAIKLWVGSGGNMSWLYFSGEGVWVPFQALNLGESEGSRVIYTPGLLLARAARLPIGHLPDPGCVGPGPIEAKWTGSDGAQGADANVWPTLLTGGLFTSSHPNMGRR